MVSTVQPGQRPPRSARPVPGGQPLTLAEEHALLLEQVTVRAEHVLAALDGGRWPAPELRALAGYLRAEVLRQAADQEWRFPAHQPGEDFARLVREHVRLRAATEVLEQAASSASASSPAQLTDVIRDLLAQLGHHLATKSRCSRQLASRVSPQLAGPVRCPASARAGGMSGIRSPRDRWPTWTGCLPGRRPTRPWTGCCAGAGGSRLSCAPPATHGRSGSR